MEKLPMCRICLVENVRMYIVVGKDLHELYETLTDIPFVTEDRRPMLACFFCFSKLKQCCQLQRKCLEAEELFAQMMNEPNSSVNRGQLKFIKGLIVTPVENISIVDVSHIESIAVKEELPAVCERLDDVIEPEEEHLKYELELQLLNNSYPDAEYVTTQQSKPHSEYDVPLIEIKTEVEEEQEVSRKKRRASDTTRIEQYLDMNLTPRSSNFNSNDIEHLKKLINKYAKVLLNKKINALSIKQKDETWEVLTKEFNALSNTHRTVRQLKTKWEYLKKSARKEAAKVNRLNRQTGEGSPAPLSKTNEWVAGILQDSASDLNSLCDEDTACNIVVQPPATPVNATDNVNDGNTGVVEEQNVDETISEYVEQSTPVSSENKALRKPLNAIITPHNARMSFLESAETKLVELKTENIESKRECSLIHLREEKVRLEMELLRKSFENDEIRKRELHELQVTKLKLEIDILRKKTA
ncbi:hypothetical protein PYW07_012917 [Mythimna separata]|uniref:Regulatory protein zeste n=1 Tax=Mythimna separata TaxID=271217 RepID=A0AAD7Y9G8_MYTSE|nr:hypothetical protein PYW07_012917 [Mythimna separata]